MTVTATTNRVSYTANGVQTVFPYPFRIFDASDLVVYVSQTLQLLTTHYAVSGVGAVTGGNVTFTSVPASGTSIILLRTLPLTQVVDLVDHDALPAETVEASGFDRLVMMIQQIEDHLGRTITLDEFSTFTGLTFADPVASELLRWKADLSGIESVDLASIDPTAVTLPLPLTQGGTGAATALTARAALGVDGQVRKVLTNRTGGALVLGDVVALDTANDTAVTLGDTASSKAQGAVALGNIADTATGEFLISGVGTVNVTGSVTRGRYLRKSATTKVAEDTGTLHGAATDPPQGSFALALTASAGGQVTARLFGFTDPGSAAPVITGLGRVVGLVGVNNTVTPLTQYDIAATGAVVRAPSGGGTLVLPTVATRTLNLATAGPAEGGRDQAAAFSANTWVYAYLIAKTDGTYHVTASLTAPPTGPVFPTGYSLWAYLGALRVNNSSQLPAVDMGGAWTRYRHAQVAITDGRSQAEAVVDCAAFVPPNALAFQMLVTGLNQISSSQYPTFRVTIGSNNYDVIGITTLGAQAVLRTEMTFPNVLQRFYYYYTADPTAGFGLHAYVRGYENPT